MRLNRLNGHRTMKAAFLPLVFGLITIMLLCIAWNIDSGRALSITYTPEIFGPEITVYRFGMIFCFLFLVGLFNLVIDIVKQLLGVTAYD